MKKGFYAILAILTVFALTMVSCGDSGGGGGGGGLTITFYSNYDDASPPVFVKVTDVAKGKAIGNKFPSTTPTRPSSDTLDYYFQQWTATAEGGTVVTSATVFDADASVYAQWTSAPKQSENDWRIIFQYDGGEADPDVQFKDVTKGTAEAPAKAGELPEPSREGYEFLGWFELLGNGSLGSVKWTAETDLTGNITLKAKWQVEAEKSTEVSFDLNLPDEDLEVDVPEDITVTPWDTAVGTLPVLLVDPAVDGYVFIGWLKEQVEADARDDEELLTAESTLGQVETITLYAYWEAYNPVEVTFNVGDGWNADGTDDDVIVTVHQGLAIGANNMPGNAFLDKNTFVEWNTVAAGGANTVFTGATPVIGTGTPLKLNVYAIYKDEPAGLPVVEKPAVTAGEWVVLDNAFEVVYKFELTEKDATWENFEKITVSYNVPTNAAGENWWDASNGARSMRLMGPYKASDFTLVTVYEDPEDDTSTVVKRVAIASYNDGKNAPYIMDDTGASWTTVANAVTLSGVGATPVTDGEELEAGKWWKVTHTFKTIRPNSGFDRSNIPHAKASGPFYFGVGISAQNGIGTLQQIKDVTLVAFTDGDYAGKTDVIGTPAYFKDADDNEYPAFTGYPDSSGGNGINEAYRSPDTRYVIPAETPKAPATADLVVLASTDTPLVNAVAFTENYNSPNGVKIPVTFPEGLNISSYGTIELTVQVSTDGGTTYVAVANGQTQVDFEAVSGPRLGVEYNAGVSTITISQGIKNKASKFVQLNFYNSAETVTHIKVTAVTFKKP